MAQRRARAPRGGDTAPTAESRYRRVTLNDVAAAAGLSITQVSRALAGYRDVAPSTQTRVRELARQLGYRPSRRARTLAKGRESTIRCAVVSLDVPAAWLHRSSYIPLLLGMLAQAATADMDVHLVTLDDRPPTDALAELAAEDRADGIVLLTHSPLRPEHVRPLEDAGIPYVLANRHFGHVTGAPEVACVTPDWVGGTRDAVERLHGLGHRRLAALFPTNELSTTLDHRQGWRDGLARTELNPTQAPVISLGSSNVDQASGQQVAQQLLTDGLPETGVRPTAVVAFNDHVAHGVLRAAWDLAIAIPQQLSVIGFDNIVAQYVWPPLCTYDPHFYEVGERAAATLAAMVRDESTARTPTRAMVPVDFVCRATCGPPPTPGGE